MSEARQWEYRAYSIPPKLIEADMNELIPQGEGGHPLNRLMKLETVLNALSADGWELVSADVTGQRLLLFKRLKPASAQPDEETGHGTPRSSGRRQFGR